MPLQRLALTGYPVTPSSSIRVTGRTAAQAPFSYRTVPAVPRTIRPLPLWIS